MLALVGLGMVVAAVSLGLMRVDSNVEGTDTPCGRVLYQKRGGIDCHDRMRTRTAWVVGLSAGGVFVLIGSRVLPLRE